MKKNLIVCLLTLFPMLIAVAQNDAPNTAEQMVQV